MNKILGSLMTFSAVSIMIGAGAFAAFSATAINSGNVFTTGTLNLTTTPATGTFNVTGMKPGDTVNQTITVNNTGSLNLTYNITGSIPTGDEPLSSDLALSVYSGATLISGPGKITDLNILSRALAATTNETLTFSVNLPSGVGNEAQGQTTNATFTFSATQAP